MLLHFAVIPTWLIPNVRSSTGRSFSHGAVRDALYHMFGPDATPNPHDVQRVTLEVQSLSKFSHSRSSKHVSTDKESLTIDSWDQDCVR